MKGRWRKGEEIHQPVKTKDNQCLLEYDFTFQLKE